VSRRLLVEADGGSRGNPGPAGAGAVVRDEATGALLAERSVWLGEVTNNVAEYRGLIIGLQVAHQHEPSSVLVRMDSKLVVEQMSGRWKIKHAGLQPLAQEAAQLVRAIGDVTFEWVPRKDNSHADRLANEAMDGRVDNAWDGTEQEGGSDSESAGSARVRESTAAESTGQPSAWTGAVGAATRMILLRHGQTRLSVDRRYSGRGEVPLTELGEQQARAAAKRLANSPWLDGPAPILASPLGRARQTAEAVGEATGGEVSCHDGLVETDFGEWEGLSFSEASQQYSELHGAWLGNPSVAPPSGESMDEVFERVGQFCAGTLQQYAGRTVVVVSHVTPIKALLRIGLDVGPSLFYRLHLDLASLSVVDFYPDGNASVRLVNDTSHLA
jgi:probable phosphoglycerate mutase